MSRGNLRCSRNARRFAQVFNKDYLVLRLIVEQLVSHGANHGNAESAWAYAQLIADVRVCNWIVLRLSNGSVRQAFEAETRARIRHALQHHARGTHVGNPHFAVGIELSTPVHGVEQQLFECQSERIAQVIREITFQLH